MRAERVYVDRIEGDVAVVVDDDGRSEQHVSRRCLPRGIREGDWLRLKERQQDANDDVFPYERDPESTARARAEVQALMDELS
jgi:hypothetical protein